MCLLITSLVPVHQHGAAALSLLLWSMLLATSCAAATLCYEKSLPTLFAIMAAKRPSF